MTAIELLPNLSAGQIEFAEFFFPVFERLKTAILLISGLLLLREGWMPGTGENHFTFERTREELSAAQFAWQNFSVPPYMDADYQSVCFAIDEISRINKEIANEPCLGNNPDAASLATHISIQYQLLRQIALRLWRLELVAESAAHRH